MTATHPPVIPLKPVRAGKSAVRVPATEVDESTPHAVTPDAVTPDAVTPKTVAVAPEVDQLPRAVTVTHSVFRGTLIGLRISAFVVLAMVVFLAWDLNWVGSIADAGVAWYVTNVAPYLEVNFVGPEVPTAEEGLLTSTNEAPLITTD